MMTTAMPERMVLDPMAADEADEDVVLLEHSMLAAFDACANIPSYVEWLDRQDRTSAYRYLAHAAVPAVAEAPVFRAVEHWAVDVRATDQVALSGGFARRGEDKFDGLETDEGLGGVPRLRGCTARFQCRTAFRYPGGDHLIAVGEVLAFDRPEQAPLVFHAGSHAHATPRERTDSQPRHAWPEGSCNEGFLGDLLGRSYVRLFARIRPFLSQVGARRRGVLPARTRTGVERSPGPGPSGYRLNEAGSACALRLISAAKAVASRAIENLGGRRGGGAAVPARSPDPCARPTGRDAVE